jgi:non-ribosomal peptide synthetase-like protein
MLPRGTVVPSGERWAGSPARPTGGVDRGPAAPRPGLARRSLLLLGYAFGVLAFPIFVVSAILPGLLSLNFLYRHSGGYSYLLLSPVVAVVFVALLCLEIAAAKWLLLGRTHPGRYPVSSGFYWRRWFFDQLMGMSLNLTGALYATSLLIPWYRLLGVKLGRNCEVSTASGFLPDLLQVGEGAFIADCVSIGAPHVDRGYIYAAQTQIGDQTFIGNSGVVPAGSVVGPNCLIGCQSACPTDPAVSTQERSSWFGSPAVALPRREERGAMPDELTYRPSRWLVLQRFCVEIVRVALPTTAFVVSTCLLITTSTHLHQKFSALALLACMPVVYAGFGALAALLVVALKWLIVGHYVPDEKPLWSRFVWRTELVTGLHENLANPFFVERLIGTPFAAWFFRALGVRIGRRVFMGTTEFTEYDLLSIGDEVCLNNDCTLQTHLFEDRVMKMSTVHLADRCTVGEDAIVLYDTLIEEGAKLGALSLLMKGETLPQGSCWQGSPATATGEADDRRR